MKKTISCSILCACIALMFFTGCKSTAYADIDSEPTVIEITTTSEDNIPSETLIQEIDSEIPIETFEQQTEDTITNSSQAAGLIQQQNEYIDTLVQYLANDENVGLNIENPNVALILTEIENAKTRISSYEEIYNTRLAEEEEVRWASKASEYESATYIWRYFKNRGFSDAAVAGILGNIMAEVGGQTLYIQYWLSSSSYYGMCQWNRGYYPGVVGLDLGGQCDFLMSTIESEFNSYGYLAGQSYSSFINSSDPQTAAKAFALVYERCGSASYSQRQRNAVIAYDYFRN